MNSVRLGIVGMGNIGNHHAQALLSGAVQRCQLTAVCRDKAGVYAQRGIAVFENASDLFRSGAADAIIIATPHYSHPELAIEAFRCGLHVLIEKPIAADKASAQTLITAAQQHPNRVFAAMFQMRAEPRYAEIKRILSNGELGEIVRFSWIATDWFRSEAYYASSAWRATWRGEGGGVLINQCLHQLDTLAWLLGMPSRVRAFVQLGRFHNIEVDDNVTAYLEYGSSATGVFVSSTGEAPGTNRLEIAGSLGKLVLENDRLQITRNAVSMFDQCKSAALGFSKPETTISEVAFPNAPARHPFLIQNFVDAVLDGSPLIAPGAEGMNSVELANAILYSGLMEKTVALPLDAGAYAEKLRELIANSTIEKKLVAVSNEDFSRSFRK